MKRLFTLMVWISCVEVFFAQDTWPRFRGEDGLGRSQAQLPENLGKQHLRWSADLPGPGSSSPVIWKDALFITGEDREGGKVTLACLDAKSGEERWTRKLAVGGYHVHQYNNFAASTPVVNQDVVVVGWFSGEKKLAMLSAFDHAGSPLWTYEVGPFEGAHGVNLTPNLYEDRIILAHLHMKGGFVGAIHAQTGKELWKTEFPGDKASYATPMVRELKDGGREVVAVSQSVGIVGLDFQTGKLKWSLPGAMHHRTIVSPFNVLAGGKSEDCLIAVGCKNKSYFAVRPPAKVGEKAEVVWKMKGRTPYVPTPVSDGETVYVINDGGTLAALEAVSGKQKWSKNLKANFYASPILVGNKLVLLTRERELIVGTVGESFESEARLTLEPDQQTEWSDATPAVAHDQLYVRIGARLDCFGKK